MFPVRTFQVDGSSWKVKYACSSLVRYLQILFGKRFCVLSGHRNLRTNGKGYLFTRPRVWASCFS